MSLRDDDWYMVAAVDGDDEKQQRQEHHHNINMVEETPRDDGISTALAALSMAATHQDQSHPVSSENRLKLENSAEMVNGVISDHKNLLFEMTACLRSIDHYPPINQVLQSKFISYIVQFLSHDDFPPIQVEAARALTSIDFRTSENTKMIIESGAIPLLIKLLRSPKDYVREQAVWTLGKVVVDSPQCCDFVLSQGAMLHLLIQFNNNAELSMLRGATWTLSSFCSSPHLALNQILPALLVLQRLVYSTDEHVLIYACLALSYLSDGNHDKRQNVIDLGVIPRLIQLLAHQSPLVLVTTLRTIGHILRGDDMQKQTLLNYHLLPGLLNLLTNTNYNMSIKQYTCWTISNIATRNTNQIQEVIQSGIIPLLVNLLQQDGFDIKKEAAWPILNVIFGGNHDQIKFLVSQGCIKPLCDLLTYPDPTVITECLNGLYKILKVGEAEKNVGNTGDYNLYAHMIAKAQGPEKIENLQSHDNKEIHDKAVHILEAFWAQDIEICDNVGEVSESNGFTGAGLPSLLESFFVKLYI